MRQRLRHPRARTSSRARTRSRSGAQIIPVIRIVIQKLLMGAERTSPRISTLLSSPLCWRLLVVAALLVVVPLRQLIKIWLAEPHTSAGAGRSAALADQHAARARYSLTPGRARVVARAEWLRWRLRGEGRYHPSRSQRAPIAILEQCPPLAASPPLLHDIGAWTSRPHPLDPSLDGENVKSLTGRSWINVLPRQPPPHYMT